jgi:MFS family permease
MVAAVISSLGAPLVPTISKELGEPLSTAQWSLTAALLAGALSAPVLGRLGDGPHRRRVLIGGLMAVTLGGIVAALAPSLAILTIGRFLQGIGLGLVPVAIATGRDLLPPERVSSVIALLSVSAAAGVGVGYPVSGFIAESFGLSGAFWFGAGISALALFSVIAVVPQSTGGGHERLDLPGTALMTTGLGALLVTLAEASTWGWSSPPVLGLSLLAIASLAAWAFHQLRSSAPLVDLRLLRHTAVLTGDVCAIVLGVAMYMNLSLIAEFVQTPGAVGYGFSASVVLAGLCLVPFSIATVGVSRTIPWLVDKVGQRAVLPLGSAVVALSSAFFAVFHGSLWQAFAMMAMLGVGVGWTYAAIPGILVAAVPEAETGSAMGFYQVVRYVGFSLGSALTASILAGNTAAGRHLPELGGYRLALWVSTAICVLAAILAWLLPARDAGRPNEDEGELAGAGLVGPVED